MASEAASEILKADGTIDCPFRRTDAGDCLRERWNRKRDGTRVDTVSPISVLWYQITVSIQRRARAAGSRGSRQPGDVQIKISAILRNGLTLDVGTLNIRRFQSEFRVMETFVLVCRELVEGVERMFSFLSSVRLSSGARKNLSDSISVDDRWVGDRRKEHGNR